MSDSLIVEDAEPGIRRLTLNRPERRNALDGDLLDRLLEALADAKSETPDVKVLVLSGTGPAFCAGADLKWLNSGVLADHGAHVAFQEKLKAVCVALEAAPQVVIGAVHGYALAGGLEVLLACDLIIAADDATIGDEHIKRNLLPGGGGSQRLPRRIGLSRGLFCLLTGHRMSGKQAEEWGLACASVPATDLDAAALDMARGLAERDGRALDSMKAMARHGYEMPLQDALWWELWTQHRYRSASGAMDAGIAAFAQGSDKGVAPAAGGR
ncbi:enoyl-CoA hydratase/isomerase family protein [Streptosporangium sp. NPDC087985]|uniref:enoyl-CoA hydratase/isomerase family protein n=1 Tax=Streptosporangium sp. NPDC087985 TaxID=3366196 RepID=UPI00382829E6